MIHLDVLLPRVRDHSGWLRIERDGDPLGEFRVLGRGSRGPGDTSFLERGNTPTGTFDGGFVETSGWRRSSYGPWGAIRLTPVGGDALLAQEIVGRRGLLIHGGSAGGSGYWRGRGALRATYGCLRVSDLDMRRIRGVIEQARYDEERLVCAEPEIRVTVREW